MNTKFYLVVNNNGTTRTCKNRPDLAWNQISMLLSLSLPDALFQKPALSAEIIIPDSAAIPVNIPAETQLNVQNAIETAVGMEVRLTMVEADET